MSRIILIALVLLLAAEDRLMAQESPEAAVARSLATEAQARRLEQVSAVGYARFQSSARVRYTITGRLAESAGIISGLPIDILSAVQEDAHLTNLNIGSGRGADQRAQFTALFTFAELAEFHAWYSTPEAQALHRAIDNASSAEDVRVDLSVTNSNALPGFGISPAPRPEIFVEPAAVGERQF